MEDNIPHREGTMRCEVGWHSFRYPEGGGGFTLHPWMGLWNFDCPAVVNAQVLYILSKVVLLSKASGLHEPLAAIQGVSTLSSK
jgi:hypothetical protein